MTFPTFSAATLAAFAAASLVLSVTPGPGVLYVVTRTLAQGRRAGLASVAGVALGNFGNAVGASIGLAALFAVSALAFTVVKWAGAAYLLWLGIQALRSPRTKPVDAPRFDAPRLGPIFHDGFLVALLNPKTALFFAAFLPQFIAPDRGGVWSQALVLGFVFVGLGLVTDSLYAVAAGTVGGLLRRQRNAVRYGSGIVFIALGVTAALAKRT